MYNAGYMAIAAQVASVNRAKVMTNDMANMNTAGFKNDDVLFQQWLYKDSTSKHSMPVDAKTITDYSQGALHTTSSPWDFALSGIGFFAIVDTNGKFRLTRNGRWITNAEGIMTDAHGRPVLSADGGEIAFEADDGRPYVRPDGTIFTQNGDVKGVLGVFNTNEEMLKTLHGDFVVNELPELADMSETQVKQGMYEESNVEAILGLAALSEADKDVTYNIGIAKTNIDSMQRAIRAFSKME